MKSVQEIRENGPLYGTYCAKHCTTAQAVGRAVATDLFVTMLNPKYRGANFTWSGLEDRAVRLCATSCFTSFAPTVYARYEALIVEDAEHSVRLTCQSLLKDSGVQEWMKL